MMALIQKASTLSERERGEVTEASSRGVEEASSGVVGGRTYPVGMMSSLVGRLLRGCSPSTERNSGGSGGEVEGEGSLIVEVSNGAVPSVLIVKGSTVRLQK